MGGSITESTESSSCESVPCADSSTSVSLKFGGVLGYGFTLMSGSSWFELGTLLEICWIDDTIQLQDGEYVMLRT